jgi:hypothetical protein
MTTHICPEFAATGIELQILELQVCRERAIEDGRRDEVAAADTEIARLWSELVELSEHFPVVSTPGIVNPVELV